MADVKLAARPKGRAFVHLSLLFSVLLWAAVTNAWGYAGMLGWHSEAYGLLSRAVWCAPFLALAARMPGLFTARIRWKPVLIAFAALTLYSLAGMLLYHGGLWWNPDADVRWLLPKFLMVGFAEEIVYRGWGQRALAAHMSGRRANLVSNLYFIALHLPAYFIRMGMGGAVDWSAVAMQAAMVLVLGTLFGYVYRKSGSIVAVMALHCWADLFSILVVG